MDIQALYERFLRHPHICTDTRKIATGSIFFALRGASFDGNRFALQALEAGCACAVVDDDALPAGDRFVHVPDALSALQQLAALHRRRLGLPVLQITGTNGKTTTKELCAAVLSRKYRVLTTEGNLNNHIGVPLTLLRLTAAHEMAVIETGANHPGEIAQLSALVGADCGLVTNVGRAHLEGFGSLEGVARTKAELYDALRARRAAGEAGRCGTPFVFLHKGDALLEEKAAGLPAVTYGAPGSGADVEGEAVGTGFSLTLRFRFGGGVWHEAATQLVGDYNLPNCLAAAAAGLRFGLDGAEIAEALAAYEPRNNRSQLVDTGRNRLIVDAYNANPTSMASALESFARLSGQQKMLLLGEMRELGDESRSEHRRVGEALARMTGAEVWLVGREWDAVDGPGTWRRFADADAARAALASERPEGRTVLLKGSNGTRLYTLVDAF
ncbi:MAG: UDP-N-acetylmuramoyl-tripeptide--D-alanyl-D-alanine ligase [Prevotellaceae bacterium]|nr:UDP-N-acetylmuramoyl-tripeptide--D-alanyl-D-alanine ligase [Prevotellaceae bacterium]